MSLCNCAERPRCEFSGGPCERAADWSIFTPPGRWIKQFPNGRLHFMCTPCKVYYLEQLLKPMKGIDRPEGVAPEDWRGSILDHIRHAQIAMVFEDRNDRPPPLGPLSMPGDEKYASAQLKQLYVLRRHLRDERRAS
jgi:hypothetical protein